jgi:hypothetical protein
MRDRVKDRGRERERERKREREEQQLLQMLPLMLLVAAVDKAGVRARGDAGTATHRPRCGDASRCVLHAPASAESQPLAPRPLVLK